MGFEAHFLAQGRVDAILLVCDGEAAFIDSGYCKNGLDCVKYMRGLGIDKLRYYISTHGHKNHIGGAGAIIHAMRPDMVIVNRPETITAIARYAQKGAERDAAQAARYAIMHAGSKVTFGGAEITCLGPLKLKRCSPGALAENYNSLVLRMDYGGRSVLLTGDTSAGILNAIHAKDKGSIRVDVLKNPHHNGSQPANTLKAITPMIVVTCSNVKPSSLYRNRIASIGARCFAACETGDGNVILRATDTGWARGKS